MTSLPKDRNIRIAYRQGYSDAVNALRHFVEGLTNIAKRMPPQSPPLNFENVS